MPAPDKRETEELQPVPEFVTWEQALREELAYIQKLGGKRYQLDFFHKLYHKAWNHDLAYCVCVLAGSVPAKFLSDHPAESYLVRPKEVLTVNSDQRQEFRDELQKHFLDNRTVLVKIAAQSFNWSEEQVKRGYE